MEQFPAIIDEIWLGAETALAKCDNYREFLRVAFAHLKSRNKHFGFAEFSRRASFSSRSYPRDVVGGKKRITPRSLPKFVKALKLTPDLESLFTILVGLEELEVFLPGNVAVEDRKKALRKIRNRLAAKAAGPSPHTQAEQFYQLNSWLPVYVSLGTAEGGATLAEVQSRTRFSKIICRRVLEDMASRKVVRKSGNRYYSESFHLIFDQLGQSEFFKSQFIRSLQEVAHSAERNFGGKVQLFFHSVFSVEEKKLQTLREELRNVILKFVDHAENPQGDRVAKISLAFYHSL